MSVRDHRLVFFGPPGAGKGTQARRLTSRFGFAHISTGVILRKIIRANTPLGQEAAGYINDGNLVPDRIVRILAEDAMLDANFSGFILDGYPRTLQQAKWLQEFLLSQGMSLTAVINFALSDEDVVSRLSQRRIHRLTGENFHLSNKPPPPEEAEFMITRPDDQPETIKQRLKTYYRDTHPLVEYYRSRDLLRPIDASGAFTEVYSQICEVLQLS